MDEKVKDRFLCWYGHINEGGCINNKNSNKEVQGKWGDNKTDNELEEPSKTVCK